MQVTSESDDDLSPGLAEIRLGVDSRGFVRLVLKNHEATIRAGLSAWQAEELGDKLKAAAMGAFECLRRN